MLAYTYPLKQKFRVREKARENSISNLSSGEIFFAGNDIARLQEIWSHALEWNTLHRTLPRSCIGSTVGSYKV